MPKLTNSTPENRKHRASGQAVVNLDGKDFYLGPHGTKTSKLEYDRLIGEWLANGRTLPAGPGNTMTVAQLSAAYWKFAKGYYVKNGKPTDVPVCLEQEKACQGFFPLPPSHSGKHLRRANRWPNHHKL